MSVSVLLPVYNAGLPLSRAIESILVQDTPNFELIIVDDGSTDGSRAKIRRYAELDERIRPIFHDQNLGLVAALNEGLKSARNELVARMDQDDEALPDRLRVQERYMRMRPTVAVAGSYVFHMGATPRHDRLIRTPVEPAEVKRSLRTYNCLYHPSVIMRRREILELGGYRSEFRNAEDYDLWLRASRVFDVANIPQPLVRYRFSVDGMTLSRKWEQLFYVYLALAADEVGGSPEDVEELARRRLSETDRSDFLSQVAVGTVKELLALRLWGDAVRVATRFARDVGVGNAVGLVRDRLRITPA